MAPRRSASRSPVRRRHGSSSATSTGRARPLPSSALRRSHRRSRSRDAPVASPPDEKQNGESSLSIEETNKLRASLGLKPLTVRSVAQKEQQDTRVHEATAKQQQEELQRTLEQSKTRRELVQKVAGKSLGEQLREDSGVSKERSGTSVEQVLEWVKQSRKTTAEEKREEQKEKTTYAASSLAGMTVGHSLDTFEDGKDVVLTLKDSNVLGRDGKDLNLEDEDELVNIELSERDRRVARQARARRAALPVYAGYDDDEFIVAMGKDRKMKTSGKKLLAQYDEEQDAVDAEAANRFRLDASGGSQALLARKREEKGDDEGDVAVISLAIDRTKRAEDYYTKEEVEVKFSHHKREKKLRKKKKRSRRQCDGDLGENDAEEVQLNTRSGDNVGNESASLIAQLEQEALQAGASVSRDRGKRKRNHHDGNDTDEEANLYRFQEAREKANAVASEALAVNTAKKRVKRRPVDDSEVMDDTAMVEMELDASLARARQLTKQRTQSQASVAPITSEARIEQLVRQSMHNNSYTEEATDGAGDVTTSDSARSGSKPGGHVFGTTGTASNTVVFNKATDFETRLRDAMEKRAAQFQAAPVKTAAAPVTEKHSNEAQKQDEEMKADEGKEAEEHSEDEETKENEVWGEEQPLVGTGMGATLALLRKTGDLHQTRVERQAGRANDTRDRSFEDDLRIKNGVKLDYRDEFGRLLTKKEAFRKLSYKFHGQEPGKKKKEKRLKQLKEELKAQKQLSGEGSTKMMKVLEKKQKHTKEAHVVLSSGV
ncbi:unnamed protein product [Hyaloperonospora brassicae]|uniref:SART-1 protein n=1 Tax=Hyaloperonospora brassicae TaxID=162125 RepID=A0AAV0UWX1_HYABA|nr:unnamed protein product [Hyaloperonospora brassicae]